MAKKGEIQITEPQIKALKLYEQRKTVQDISAALKVPSGTVQGWMRKFKLLGITSGSHKERAGVTVHWDRLEEIQAGTAAIPDSTNEIPDSTDEIPGEIQRERKRNTASEFTPAEIKALKRIAQRETGPGRAFRSGQSKMISGRLDSGLMAALRERADEEGVSLTKMLDRAVERYLND